jgi:general secretion pathway protein N
MNSRFSLSLDSLKVIQMRWFWRIGLILVIAFVVLMQMPAQWAAKIVNSQVDCRVLLTQAQGSIWDGSVAIGFSERAPGEAACKPVLGSTSRIIYKTQCFLGLGKEPLGCHSQLFFPALANPLRLSWDLGGVKVDGGEIALPANILEGLGSPWTTLRPRGDIQMRWSDLQFGSIQRGDIHFIISDVSSPVSPVKPLGSYDLKLNLVNDGNVWKLSTSNGPLILSGEGAMHDGKVQFSGVATADPEMFDSLVGLLSLLGKKEGDVYRLKL